MYTRRHVVALAIALIAFAHAAFAITPSAPLVERCPSTPEVGANVMCYPVSFKVLTRVHPPGNSLAPDGVPVIAYLFVPKNLDPSRKHPAIIFAHGSGSMYSSGRHNRGLNSKHLRWVRQYTEERGYVGLHVDSFHSRYLLPDTPGVTNLDATVVPAEPPGGDDYFGEAVNRTGFDPDNDRWSDSANGRDGVSEILERPYDAFAGYDFLVGARDAATFAAGRAVGETLATNYAPGSVGRLRDIVGAELTIDPAQVFLYGTSHGGQTAMAAAHRALAEAPENPVGPGARFAGFLDFYGGCGLFSAFGGAGAGSTWRPSAPFLMFHGEMDTTIWDNVPIDSRAKWDAEDCAPRIAAAKADPSFDGFLETLVYAGARHDFEDVWRDDIGAAGESDEDFPDWRAKAHSNYVVALPFMEALRRIAVARERGETAPSLAELGFSTADAAFVAVPFRPALPPEALPAAHGTPLPIASSTGGTLALGEYVRDPLLWHELNWSLVGAPTGVMLDAASGMLSIANPIDLPVTFWIRIDSVGGTLVLPATLAADGNGAQLALGQGFAVTAAALPVPTPAGRVDLQSFIRATMGSPDSHELAFAPSGVLPSGLSVTGTHLEGNFAALAPPVTQTFFADLNGQRLAFELRIATENGLMTLGLVGVHSVNGGGVSTSPWPALHAPPGEPPPGHTPPNDPPPQDPPEDGPSVTARSGGGAVLWLLLMPLALGALRAAAVHE